jgi:hypothetical protein
MPRLSTLSWRRVPLGSYVVDRIIFPSFSLGVLLQLQLVKPLQEIELKIIFLLLSSKFLRT